MLKKPLTLEFALYILAISLALGLRFLHLGTLSLSDYEARFALESLGIASGGKEMLGSNPAYTNLTAILFFIFSGSDFTARFLPALAGAGLLMAPFFLRERIGRLPALVLAFGLALDPGLNAMSRLAGGPMLAVTCLVLTGVFWWDRRPIPAGIFAGLALLSGPSVWFGLLTLLLGWGAYKLIPGKFWQKDIDDSQVSGQPEAGIKESRMILFKQAFPWSLGTLLVAGTLFVLSPQGLASMVRSLIDFVSAWWRPSGIPLGRIFLAIPAYELLPLLFGLIHLVRGFIKRDKIAVWLSFWLLAALLVVVACQGRQVSDLLWALLPLWVLAARELGLYFNFSGINRWVVGSVITAMFILLILGWLTLTRISNFDPLSMEARLQWLFLGGILLVIIISLIMVGSGWSLREATLGGAWGFLIPLVLFTIAMSTGAAGVRDPRTLELWTPEPRLGRPDLLLKVANQISFLNTGMETSLPLRIVNVDSPAVSWLFRDWQKTETDIFDPTETPELIITPLLSGLTLTADYRGEPLVWRETGDWYNATFSTWLKWYIYRQIPTQKDSIVLWVRTDLMIDSLDQEAPAP